MLRCSRAQQLTGKRKGKVQEDEEITKVSRVDRLHKRNIGLLIIPFFYVPRFCIPHGDACILFSLLWGIVGLVVEVF